MRLKSLNSRLCLITMAYVNIYKDQYLWPQWPFLPPSSHCAESPLSLSPVFCECRQRVPSRWVSPIDDWAVGLAFPTSSLREYRTGYKFSKQAESMPLMAAGTLATLPLIIWYYREIRWEKTTSHVPAASAQRSAGFLIRRLSWNVHL